MWRGRGFSLPNLQVIFRLIGDRMSCWRTELVSVLGHILFRMKQEMDSWIVALPNEGVAPVRRGEGGAELKGKSLDFFFWSIHVPTLIYGSGIRSRRLSLKDKERSSNRSYCSSSRRGGGWGGSGPNNTVSWTVPELTAGIINPVQRLGTTSGFLSWNCDLHQQNQIQERWTARRMGLFLWPFSLSR